jgi:hypothetical protein
MYCNKFPIAPYKPQPPNPEEALRWEEANEESRKLGEVIDAYHDGTGPCPYCVAPDGEEHAYTCWENE